MRTAGFRSEKNRVVSYRPLRVRSLGCDADTNKKASEDPFEQNPTHGDFAR